MAEQQTALIIPFPRRAEPDRLALALAGLDAALAEQRTVCATWRASLGELREAMHGLNGSMRDYDLALTSLSAGVDQLGEQSRRLEATADQALAVAHS